MAIQIGEIPAGFTQRGHHWLVSPSHGIEFGEVYHGTNFCVYRWEYIGDVWRELIGVRQALAEAVRLTEVQL